MTVNVKDFGAIGNGIIDDSGSIQTAINTAYTLGEQVYIPSGNYKIGITLVLPFSCDNICNKGNYIYGEGPLRTKLFIESGGISIFKLVQPSPGKYQYGVSIQNMSLNGQGQSQSSGIEIQAAFNIELNNLEVCNFSKGIVFNNVAIPGDLDACNHISISNCRLKNNAQWGLITNVSSGNNEISFLNIRNTSFSENGTAAGAIGGGMYWRGQCLQFDCCDFTANNNRGLYIEGGAGLGSNILGNNLCFENNKGMGIQCYGIVGMEFNQLQIYNNDNFIASYGLYLSGNSSVIANVKVNSAKIRASTGNNPYTAFCAFGQNAATATIVVDSSQVRWDDFGHPGQQKYSGFTVI